MPENITDGAVDFEYNSYGQLIFSRTTSGFTTNEYMYESNSSKNPMRIKSGGEVVEYEFDNKPNSLSGLGQSLAGRLITNNITKATYYYLGDLRYLETYAYQYNEKGYPTQEIKTSTYDWVTYQKITRIYEYNCR